MLTSSSLKNKKKSNMETMGLFNQVPMCGKIYYTSQVFSREK